jgi:hypothetical protein
VTDEEALRIARDRIDHRKQVKARKANLKSIINDPSWEWYELTQQSLKGLFDDAARHKEEVKLLRNKNKFASKFPQDIQPAESFKLGFKKNEDVFKIFFHFIDTPDYYVAKKIVDDLAYRHFILENEPDDNNSINHVAIFKPNQIQELAFLNFLVHRKGVRGGFWGISLYGVNLCYIQRHLEEVDFKIPHYCGDYAMGGKSTNNKAKLIIEQLKERYSEKELSDYITYKYMLPSQIEYQYTYDYLNILNKTDWEENEEFRLRRDLLRTRAVKEGEVPIKWKSEFNLFMLISEVFPDAIFQYNPIWLDQLTIDIYVPSCKVAFEYQGIQHFEAVERFGGEEGLQRRRISDTEKRELCIEQGVKIIYWNYDIPVAKENLLLLLEKYELASNSNLNSTLEI